MSSDKRQRAFNSHDGASVVEPEPPPPPPHIPVDLLRVEIFALLDVASVVRCAATSKAFRRAILGDPAIGRRVEANSGAVLLGVSYAIVEYTRACTARSRDVRVSSVGQAPLLQKDLGFRAGKQLECLEPVASRGGLIVLRRRRIDPKLFVWNTATSRMPLLVPAADVAVGDEDYPHDVHALLTVGDAGRAFQLLVVSTTPASPALRTQIYSEEGNRWGPVTEVTDCPRELVLPRYAPPSRRPEALVLGGGTAVHWLHNDSGRCIIRLDIGEAKATLIEPPPQFVHRPVDDGEFQLAASTDGELSLVVAERCGAISMWTLSAVAAPGEGGSARWTRQVVVQREAIDRRVPTGRYKDHLDLFLGFGELCGLGLGSDDELKKIEAAHDDGMKKIEACLHEIDLLSFLQVMKPY